MRIHVMHLEYPAVTIQEGDRQGNKGISHPETQNPVLRVDEQHAVVWRQVSTEGKPAGSADRIRSKLHGQGMLARCDFYEFVLDRTRLACPEIGEQRHGAALQASRAITVPGTDTALEHQPNWRHDSTHLALSFSRTHWPNACGSRLGTATKPCALPY